MLSLSPLKLVIVVVVALVLIGPDKLPKMARQIGAAWNGLRSFRERIESEVRENVPDLPATHDIVRAVRSPASFLDRLADEHANEQAAASQAANDRLSADGASSDGDLSKGADGSEASMANGSSHPLANGSSGATLTGDPNAPPDNAIEATANGTSRPAGAVGRPSLNGRAESDPAVIDADATAGDGAEGDGPGGPGRAGDTGGLPPDLPAAPSSLEPVLRVPDDPSMN